jgi:hypothetical protein
MSGRPAYLSIPDIGPTKTGGTMATLRVAHVSRPKGPIESFKVVLTIGN